MTRINARNGQRMTMVALTVLDIEDQVEILSYIQTPPVK